MAIERAATDLQLCMGYSTSLDEAHSVKNELQLMKIQRSASSGKSHFLTLIKEDQDQLQPGKYLNDTIVEFWMQWISRKEAMSRSSVHFFTSHFYTTLLNDRVEGVLKECHYGQLRKELMYL
jgi:Ulp1 family protease